MRGWPDATHPVVLDGHAADEHELAVPQRLVERTPVPRAAGIVLAVRADEEERIADRSSCEEVEPTEVVVRLELGSCDGRLARSRGDREGDEQD